MGALVMLVGLVGCATTFDPARVGVHAVPEAVRVPTGQILALEARARGVQVYECRSGAESGKFEWALKGPEAELYDMDGTSIGKHYAGPTWEVTDGSKVVGEVKAKDAGPDANAVPWLLMAAKSTEGPGVLGKIASIQRLATIGGKAPADGCSRDREGAVVRVGYKAIYRFYR